MYTHIHTQQKAQQNCGTLETGPMIWTNTLIDRTDEESESTEGK